MIKPNVLKAGDTIAIVAPARKTPQTNIESTKIILEGWGLKVVLGKNLYSNVHSYLSGSDAERLEDFQTCLDDTNVRAIIAARGGYGSTRIVDVLNTDSLMKDPKWIIGFSDITAFHLKLLKGGFMSIHGTMPILFSNPQSNLSISSLKSVLFTGGFSIDGKSVPINRTGKAKGILVGGNLSLIADSLGTPSELITENRILFIEEIDEYKYKLDRMMTQLKRAGKLKNLKALLVGHMTDIKDSDLPFGESAYEIIQNSVRDYHYPVAYGIPSGHENPNLAWIHGSNVSLIVDDDGVNLKMISASQ
jgi:muramoyltetrapeptide carboxypeptidase